MLNLNTPINKTFHIKPTQAQKLEKLGIKVVGDFLFHFPSRYDDLSKIVKISEIVPEQSATVSGEIINFSVKRSWRKKISIIEIHLKDETGIIRATWFNQKYLIDVFSKNRFIRLSGKAKLDSKGFHFSNPIWEVADKNPNHTGRIVPIYPETKGITSKWLRWQIETIFKNDFEITDPLTPEMLKKYHLPSLKKSLYDIHFPKSEDSYLVAQKRFAFFDMFLIQLRSLQIKKQLKKESAQELKYPATKIKEFLSSLPFELTKDQKKAFEEIKKDLAKNHPMNRLLNGDVGSGKTIVAMLSALQAAANGFQVAIMAPTEVLAYQHFNGFSKWLANFDISIGLLTNSYKLVRGSQFTVHGKENAVHSSRSTVHGKKNNVISHQPLEIVHGSQFAVHGKKSALENSKLLQNSKFEIRNSLTMPAKLTREEILKNINNGTINIVIGTHAIIQKDIRFNNLALIIIDEQHRFGVAQRAALQRIAQTNADYIQTSAEKILNEDITEKSELLYKDITYKIRGALFNVKKQLGLGHKEKIYQKALEEEFKKTGLKFEKEKSIDIEYDNKNIGTYRPDFIVENKIILELKALPLVGKFEQQQIWHYLKASNYKLALLANFSKKDIEIKRIINSTRRKSASSPHKSEFVPHFLTMTATPIPRTISMTLLGSLDVSLITEMPKNRKSIITKVVLPAKQNEIYNFIREEIKNGRQAFVILPLVEESEKLTELKAAITEHERLSREIFPEFKLGLLHGRMKGKEKEEIMMDFKNKKTDILVSTSVIEVGIDIPNATVMIIEEAYRFGLSQLHQFRGRVGRGEHQSYCFLFAKNSTARLRILEKYNDGFKVAQEDLEIRGPGDFLGTRQSGLADSTMQNITNIKMIKCAYEEAKEIIKKDIELKNHPSLQEALKKMNQDIHLE